jgi:hypothetical protein
MPTLPESPARFIHTRPGVVKTLGICNIVFATLGALYVGWSVLVIYAISNSPAPQKVVQVEVKAGQAPGPGVPLLAGFDPFMGMRDKNYLRFSIVDDAVNLIISSLMFATGIGLLNLKRWAARGWGVLAWIRIGSAVLLWGYYIVGVAPGFSENMAKEVSNMIAAQGNVGGAPPPVAFLTMVYSVMNLSRPGVKAALADNTPALERELP